MAAPGEWKFFTAPSMIRNIKIAPADDCEVYNRLLPGSMPFEWAAHFPAVPVNME